MSNEQANKQKGNEIIPHDVNPSTWSALKQTLYPGAKDESIKMVLDYCTAAGLDPMQKPVHIVPMSMKDEKGGFVWRDTVMPGIGLYRIQAARSGLYAGISEPEFGDDVTEKLGDVEVTYPKWCKVTIKKQLNGQIIEFTAKEYWKENYATTKGKVTPNNMWAKRPYGQLAKCTEAQALRKAFPEIITSQPTAEEMEGKTFDNIKDVTPSIPEVKTTLIQPKISDRNSLIFLDVHSNKQIEVKITDVYTWLETKIAKINSKETMDAYDEFRDKNSATLKKFAEFNRSDALEISEKAKFKRELYNNIHVDYTPAQGTDELRELEALKAEKAASVGMDDIIEDSYERAGDYEYEQIKAGRA